MLQDLKGKTVRLYLNLSAWGDSSVKGEVVEVDDTWLRLKSKKGLEFVNLAAIKRIVVEG